MKTNLITKIINIFLISSIILSCGSKKNIYYVQNLKDNDILNVSYFEHKIKVDDVLKIDVTAEIPESTSIFKNSSVNSTNNKESFIYNGYQVNTMGYISFPSLGDIKVKGMTITELKEHIKELIIKDDLINSPSVDIKLLNGNFTILGEVNMPGRYEFFKNNINIFEAIGIAGDLTINGKRNDIKLIRTSDEKTKTIYNIDLTKSSFIENSTMQIFSGDIIIVNPNTTRVKNAGIIGNSGTLLSLLSFILSSIIVISSN
tara:strand:- start:225 stop:1001 length:777 start_codon:yes stop_codon:yes gene_type:complete